MRRAAAFLRFRRFRRPLPSVFLLKPLFLDVPGRCHTVGHELLDVVRHDVRRLPDFSILGDKTPVVEYVGVLHRQCEIQVALQRTLRAVEQLRGFGSGEASCWGFDRHELLGEFDASLRLTIGTRQMTIPC